MNRAPMIALKLVNGDARSETRRLAEDGSLVVGRDPAAHWRFGDHLMSRLHARFTLRHGQLVVEDLKSRLGTVVNGRSVPAHLPVELKPGDRIFVGCVALQVVALDPAAPASSEPASRFVPRHGLAYANQPTMRFPKEPLLSLKALRPL